MIGVGCGCAKKANVRYQVNLGPSVPAPERPIIKDTASAARAAIVAAGNPAGATFKAVSA